MALFYPFLSGLVTQSCPKLRCKAYVHRCCVFQTIKAVIWLIILLLILPVFPQCIGVSKSRILLEGAVANELRNSHRLYYNMTSMSDGGHVGISHNVEGNLEMASRGTKKDTNGRANKQDADADLFTNLSFRRCN